MVTLQHPREDETRVDPVLSRDVQRKRSVEMGFGKAAVLPTRLISRWPSKHKTYRRQQSFRYADHWRLPRDVQRGDCHVKIFPARFGVTRVERWRHSVFVAGLWSRRSRRGRRFGGRFDSHFHLGAWLEAHLVAIFVRQSVLDANLSI